MLPPARPLLPPRNSPLPLLPWPFAGCLQPADIARLVHADTSAHGTVVDLRGCCKQTVAVARGEKGEHEDEAEKTKAEHELAEEEMTKADFLWKFV